MNRIDQLHAQWQNAVERDRTSEVTKVLVELEQLQPNDALWSHRLGDAYRRAGRNDEAVAAFVRAMERYRASGFLPRAIAMAKLVTTIDPKRTDLLAQLTPPKVVRTVAVPSPLERAPDSLPDEIRFSDGGAHSGIEIFLDDIDVELVEEVPAIDRLAAMSRFCLFSGVSHEALVALADAADLVEFEPNAIVIARNDVASSLYAIVSGTAVVDVGGTTKPERLGENEVFGEAALLGAGRRYADVRAETPLTVLRIAKSMLDPIVTKFPEIEHALFDLLARRLVGNLMSTSPLFNVFEPRVRVELAQMFEARRADAGTLLTARGKKTDGIYLVLAGEVVSEGPHGVTRVPRGMAIGQAELLANVRSSLTIRAMTDAVVLRLPAARFSTLALTYPPVLEHLAETAERPLVASAE